MLGRHRAFNRNDLKLGLTDWAYNIDSHNNWLAASVMFRLGKIESGTRLHFSQRFYNSGKKKVRILWKAVPRTLAMKDLLPDFVVVRRHFGKTGISI
jgi:hypothetical protein